MSGPTDNKFDEDSGGEALAWEGATLWLRLRETPADAALRDEVERWRSQSATHDGFFRAAGDIWELAGSGESLMPPAHIGSARRRSRWGRPTHKAWGTAIAAAAAACLAIAVVPSVALIWQSDHRTETGEVRTVDLADGSTVTLDAGSAIALDDAPGRRGVRLLAGRAWFGVERDKNRPFNVIAGEARVVVTGTQFDVALGDDAIDIGLAEGGIEAAWGRGRRLVMKPGDRLHIGRRNQSATRARAMPAAMGSWRRGRLMLENATLADGIAALQRYHKGAILLADDNLGGRRITGVFDARSPERALRLMVGEHGGRVSEITPWILVVTDGDK